MKLSYIIILIISMASFFSCNKEEPILSLDITPSSLSLESGTRIDFDIQGDSEFLVFYSGLPGEDYDEYPNAAASSINMLSDDPNFSYKYNYHGPITGVFVATSFGNWASDKEDKVFRFDFNIVDNNSNLFSVILKTPGLGGKEYVGVIDNENKTVLVTLENDLFIKKLTTNIVPFSPLAEIFYNDISYVNKSSVDFSSGSRTFTVQAIGGGETNWTINVEIE